MTHRATLPDGAHSSTEHGTPIMDTARLGLLHPLPSMNLQNSWNLTKQVKTVSYKFLPQLSKWLMFSVLLFYEKSCSWMPTRKLSKTKIITEPSGMN
jgi:hypothetical protein